MNWLLYRIFVDASDETSQLLVPNCLRETVFLTAHDSVISGHTGVARVTKRVLSQFFWPVVRRDVRTYRRNCDACQRTLDKCCIPSAPLHQMLLIEEPFKRVALDLVGPFNPISERGHRCILTGFRPVISVFLHCLIQRSSFNVL